MGTTASASANGTPGTMPPLTEFPEKITKESPFCKPVGVV